MSDTDFFPPPPSPPPIRPAAGVASTPEVGGLPRPALIDAYPNFTRRVGGFLTVPVDASLVTTGMDAWYVFRRIVVDAALADTPLLQQVEIIQRPCDVDGGALSAVTGATNHAWGDTLGLSARIVVGFNLPMPLKSWTTRPASIIGLHYGAGTQPSGTTMSDNTDPTDYAIIQDFPTGSFRDPRPVDRREVYSYKPNARRLARGESVDFALVISGRYIHNKAAGQLVGFCQVAAEFTMTDTAGMR